MDKIFEVEIYNKRLAVDFWLPATDYQLLDAIGKLGIENNVSPSLDIQKYAYSFQNLSDVMEKDRLNLFELNALAQRLSQFELEDEIAFHALVLTRLEREGGNIPTRELLDLAYSTDCCEVHPDVDTYEELGHFYVENDMVPELKNVPEEALPFLDYGQIGRKLSEAECGMLAPGGYVTQTSELKEISQGMEFVPPKPGYSILLELTGKDSKTQISLPASGSVMFELEYAINTLWPSESRAHASVRCLDCAVPALIPVLSECGIDQLKQMNKLAKTLQGMAPTQLNKFKAVLDATEERSILGAMQVMETLDEYLFSPQVLFPEDMAQDFLASSMGVKALDTLSKFVNLYGYGEALMEEQNCVQTEYGLVSREDGQSLTYSESQGQESTNEMTV